MANTELRLFIFFAAKDGEALYSQQKQDRELTVAQIMNSLLKNSDLNLKKSMENCQEVFNRRLPVCCFGSVRNSLLLINS